MPLEVQALPEPSAESPRLPVAELSLPAVVQPRWPEELLAFQPQVAAEPEASPQLAALVSEPEPQQAAQAASVLLAFLLLAQAAQLQLEELPA